MGQLYLLPNDISGADCHFGVGCGGALACLVRHRSAPRVGMVVGLLAGALFGVEFGELFGVAVAEGGEGALVGGCSFVAGAAGFAAHGRAVLSSEPDGVTTTNPPVCSSGLGRNGWCSTPHDGHLPG